MRHAAAILAAVLLAVGAQAQESGPDPAQRVRDRLATMKIEILKRRIHQMQADGSHGDGEQQRHADPDPHGLLRVSALEQKQKRKVPDVDAR